MALVMSSSAQNRPWMLKEYLLDNLGSCSSDGFRSFPRRNCCAAVRNLIDLEHRSRRSSSKISCAIRKASKAIVGAVKLLPFKSPAKQKSSGKKKTLLPRSLSRGFGKRMLLQKELSADDRSRDCEIERWISSGAAAAEKYQPLDSASNETTITSASTPTSSTNRDSWSESDSEFTLTCSSAESTRCRSVSGTVRDASTEAATTKNNWSEEEDEKDNLSPVSVLNFPDDVEETGSSSPFTCRLKHLEGTKEKLMQKLRRFECLSQIDPLNMESQLSLTAYSDNESLILSFQSPPSPQHMSLCRGEETEDKAAERLLKLIKSKMVESDACKFNMDSLLLNFFVDGLVNGREKKFDLVEETLLKEAGDWLMGICHDEVAKSWKVKEKRQVYVEDVEGGVWRSNDVEKDEVVVQVEAQVLASLVDELMEVLIG